MMRLETLSIALALTVAMEAAVLFFIARDVRGILLASLFANLMTNPAANLLFEWIGPTGIWMWVVVILIELAVVVIEASVYARVNHDVRVAFRWSLYANAASFVVGSLVLWAIEAFAVL